jgi:hypothetical protein
VHSTMGNSRLPWDHKRSPKIEVFPNLSGRTISEDPSDAKRDVYGIGFCLVIVHHIQVPDQSFLRYSAKLKWRMPSVPDDKELLPHDESHKKWRVSSNKSTVVRCAVIARDLAKKPDAVERRRRRTAYQQSPSSCLCPSSTTEQFLRSVMAL